MNNKLDELNDELQKLNAGRSAIQENWKKHTEGTMKLAEVLPFIKQYVSNVTGCFPHIDIRTYFELESLYGELMNENAMFSTTIREMTSEIDCKQKEFDKLVEEFKSETERNLTKNE